MTELNVRDLLDAAATEPLPATHVDIGRAIATGRHRVTRRRRLAIGGVALAVCLVLGSAAGVLALNRDPAPQPATTPSPPAAFDVLVPYAAFGWLPDGVPHRETRGASSLLIREATDRAKGDAAPRVRLRVGAADTPLDPAERAFTSTAPVGGRPALILTGAAWTTLRWEYAAGAWAEVDVVNLPGDHEAVARKIAASVRFGQTERIRLPFVPPRTVSGMPVTVVTLVDDGPKQWRASVEWGRSQSGPPAPLRITVAPGRDSLQGGNTTVDGRAARVVERPADEQLLMMSEPGWLFLRMDAREGTTLPPGGLVDVYRSLRFTPDPANWE